MTTATGTDELAVFLEEARERASRAGGSQNTARNLESWIASANDELAEVTRLRGELDAAVKPSRMWERAYMDVQRVLDEALGTGEGDGAGSGTAGDVWLLAHQRDEARAKLAAITAHCRRRTEWVTGRPDTLLEALVKAADIMMIVDPPGEEQVAAGQMPLPGVTE